MLALMSAIRQALSDPTRTWWTQEELAAHCQRAKSTIGQALAGLADQGEIESRPNEATQRGPGRPAKVYRLIPDGRG